MSLPYVKTDSELKSILSSHEFVLVNFTASWCGPCKAIAPQVVELAQKHKNIYFVKIDIDENDDSPAAYQVSAVPTFILFKKGVEQGKILGASYEKLQGLVAIAG